MAGSLSIGRTAITWGHSQAFQQCVSATFPLILERCDDHTPSPDLNISHSPPQAMHSVDFHPKSRILVSGGEDSIVRVWDLKEKRVAMTWKSHATSVVSVRCCPDEDHVASASIDGVLYVHNLRNGKTVTKLQMRGEDATDALKMIQYSPHERSRIATCTDKGKVTVWESSRAKVLASIAAHVAPCTAIAYSHVNAALLLSSSLDKTVKLHDIRARKTVSTINLANPATSLDLASDGATLAIGTAGGQIAVYDLQKSAQPLWTLAIPNHTGEIEHVTFQHAAATSKPAARSSAAATDNYFAPSPSGTAISATNKADTAHDQARLSRASSSAQLASSSSSTQLSAVELFSPVRFFDGAASSDSVTLTNPQQHVLASASLETEKDDFEHPFSHPFQSIAAQSSLSASANMSSVGMQVLSPVQQPQTAPSGAPLSLLSPAPPTPSSYRYNNSRLSANLFSPIAATSSAAQTSTPSRSSSSFLLNQNELSPIPIAPLGTVSDALPLASPRLSLSARRDIANTPSALALANSGSSDLFGSPLNTSTPGLPPGTLSATSSSSSLFERTQRPIPGSPSAPRGAIDAPISASAPAAPLDSSSSAHEGIQWQLVQNVLGDMMQNFRADVQTQLQNMHLEIIRQFHIQQSEIASLLQQYDTNKQLLDIIKDLKEENERLRKLY